MDWWTEIYENPLQKMHVRLAEWAGIHSVIWVSKNRSGCECSTWACGEEGRVSYSPEQEVKNVADEMGSETWLLPEMALEPSISN